MASIAFILDYRLINVRKQQTKKKKKIKHKLLVRLELAPLLTIWTFLVCSLLTFPFDWNVLFWILTIALLFWIGSINLQSGIIRSIYIHSYHNNIRLLITLPPCNWFGWGDQICSFSVINHLFKAWNIFSAFTMEYSRRRLEDIYKM